MTEHIAYLGREVTGSQPDPKIPVHYALDHLTTHALLLGATGSGKTGMGLVIVEECLRKGIPVLLLDIKGDLSNLLLTFPELRESDFAPWTASSDAAAQTAKRWREGLASWGLSAQDIADLREAADIKLYTPGLRAGNPVDILAQFNAPPSGDPDETALHAQGLASALLSLAGMDADPLQSREHILLTTLVRHAWEKGAGLDIATLIQQVQNPPVQHVGVFDVDSFLPAQSRQALALTLNNLLAAPGFAQWHVGQPLRIDDYLFTPDGTPRASIFYLAHLPEPQQRFFVTLFLEELRTWVRKQPGSRNLRALLFFDEVYGYLPPYPANPPSKAPLMALVKQGRAAGLGLLLSTQNAADLDYKGLGNIGTWFVGTLRTERDKHRVLEAMEGAVAQLGKRVSEIDRALSNLDSRVFLMYDTRAGDLKYMQSRWAMSYLRGPLTTAEARDLAAVALPGQPAPAREPTYPQRAAVVAVATAQPVNPVHLTRPPNVDAAIPQAFLPANITASWALRESGVDAATARLVYCPYLLGVSTTHLHDERTQTSLSDEQVWRVAGTDESWNLRWENGEMIALRIEDLSTLPAAGASFLSLPREFARKTAYSKWQSTLLTHVRRSGAVKVWGCAPLKLYSRPGVSKRIFLEQCRDTMLQRREQALAAEKRKYERRAAYLEARIRKEELELEHDQMELTDRRREELISGAETVMALFNRHRRTRALTQTSRQRRYVRETEADVDESEEMLDIYYRQADELEASWQTAAKIVIDKWDGVLDQINEITLYPKRTDIEVRFCGLAWFPYWTVDGTDRYPAYVS